MGQGRRLPKPDWPRHLFPVRIPAIHRSAGRRGGREKSTLETTVTDTQTRTYSLRQSRSTGIAQSHQPLPPGQPARPSSRPGGARQRVRCPSFPWLVFFLPRSGTVQVGNAALARSTGLGKGDGAELCRQVLQNPAAAARLPCTVLPATYGPAPG